MDNTLKKSLIEDIDSKNTKITDVSTEVTTSPVEKDSDPIHGIYVFSYTIKLINNTLNNIQLINRHWRVFSAGIQIADVKGDGVVGHQPRFRPADSFQYTSYTVLKDPIGKMVGSYTFVTEDGVFFDTSIEPFELSYMDRLSLH